MIMGSILATTAALFIAIPTTSLLGFHLIGEHPGYIRAHDPKRYEQLEDEHKKVMEGLYNCARDNECNRKDIRELLFRLKRSPFFDNDMHRPEYDNLLAYSQRSVNFTRYDDTVLEGGYNSYHWLTGLREGPVNCRKSETTKECLLRQLDTKLKDF